jgi:hypothetical protein
MDAAREAIMTAPVVCIHTGGQVPERKERRCNKIPTLAANKGRLPPATPARRR